MICVRTTASIWTVLVLLVAGCGSLEPIGASGPPSLARHPAAEIAESLVGTPYRYGGASPRGFDCSGLVYYAFTQAGYKTPRTTQGQYRRARALERWELRGGDLLFFQLEGKVSHVGVYVGNGTFVHAPSSGKAVSYATLSNPYWRKRLVKAGRL